jgi:hypothetical protein
MRRFAASAVVVFTALCWAALPGVGASAAAGGLRPAAGVGTWGKALKVPGLAKLDHNGYAAVTSVSCSSPGTCGAAGWYATGLGRDAAGFVVSEVRGSWRTAHSVPGLADLNKRGDAEVTAISCTSAGNCGAGGYYEAENQRQQPGHQQAFVVSEVHGTWGKAREVPGLGSLNTGGDAAIDAVSCTSAGNCSAAGGYATARSASLFVVREVSGKWRDAEQMPGIAKLNLGNSAEMQSLSCGAKGYCGAGGYYTDKDGDLHAFVVLEVNGGWRDAEEVPGTHALNKGPIAQTSAVSCPTATFCSAVGFYEDSEGGPLPFVTTESGGTWRSAEKVAGTSAGTDLSAVSCASPGDCSAGGRMYAGAARWQAFVVSEVRGTWGPSEKVPGITALNKAGDAAVTGMSCSATGDCSAAGYYDPSDSNPHAFVVTEVHGVWKDGEQVPGAAAIGPLLKIASISCGGPGACAAGGSYRKNANGTAAFLVRQS